MLLYHSNSSFWWNVLISGGERERLREKVGVRVHAGESV